MYRQQQQVFEIEQYCEGGPQREMHPSFYGSGWGDPKTSLQLRGVYADLMRLLWEETPVIGGRVIEIGCGGGRWTQLICEHRETSRRSYEIVVTDATERARELTYAHCLASGVNPPDQFLTCPTGHIQPDGIIPADVVCSFDVFVHFDEFLISNYLESIAARLRIGGKALISFACEFPPDTPGWQRSDEWFNYIMSPGGFIESFELLIDRYFDSQIVALWPIGYGQAVVMMTRR